MDKEGYLGIVSHYESCLGIHGDSHLGVDWPNPEEAETRYKVMLEVLRKSTAGRPTLLDFGCGTSLLYESMLRHKFDSIDYSGLDISEKYIEVSRQKFAHIKYYCLDILKDDDIVPDFDYIVLNGVFTEKRELSLAEMWEYFQALSVRVFAKARVGIAFNVMSKQVDWERDDLFHVPLDDLAWFVTRNLSRHLVIRQDYGLYEYTTYVYRASC